MGFNEFSEFENPLSKDYDITSGLKSDNNVKTNGESERKRCIRELFNILDDIPEDIDSMSDVSFVSQYGITKQEYENPNDEVVRKAVRFQKQNSQHSKQK